MSYSERRNRKNRKAKHPAQIRQELARSQGRHIHPQETGYWHEYTGKHHTPLTCRPTNNSLIRLPIIPATEPKATYYNGEPLDTTPAPE